MLNEFNFNSLFYVHSGFMDTISLDHHKNVKSTHTVSSLWMRSIRVRVGSLGPQKVKSVKHSNFPVSKPMLFFALCLIVRFFSFFFFFFSVTAPFYLEDSRRIQDSREESGGVRGEWG